MLNAFSKTMEALASATMLHHSVQDAPTSLTAGASNTATVDVLEQIVGGW